MAGPSLNVSLTAHLQGIIAAYLESGRYQSASEVVRAGLRLLEKFEAAGGGPSADFCPVCGRDRTSPAEGVQVRTEPREGLPIGQ